MTNDPGPTTKDIFYAYADIEKYKPAARTRAHSEEDTRNFRAAAAERIPVVEPHLCATDRRSAGQHRGLRTFRRGQEGRAAHRRKRGLSQRSGQADRRAGEGQRD